MTALGSRRISARLRTGPLPRWRSAMASTQTRSLLSRSLRRSQLTRVAGLPAPGASMVIGAADLAGPQVGGDLDRAGGVRDAEPAGEDAAVIERPDGCLEPLLG